MKLRKIINTNFIKDISILLVAPLRFCFTKIAVIVLNFYIFLPLTNALVTAFSKRLAPTSRKFLAEQGILILNLLGTGHFNILVALLRFCFRKIAFRMLNFWGVLPLKEPLVDSLPENMYLAQAWAIQIFQKKLNFFGCTPLFSLLRFFSSECFTYKRTFGSYFQWNLCTDL